MRLYCFLRGLLRAALGAFFRRVEVVGREHVPADGPVIFCGNHPNSLLDPIIIIATCGRLVQFAAKDVLFRSRFLRFFLDALGAVPVRRQQDHGAGPVDNEALFDRLFAALGAGGAMGIFPEGLSHDDAQLARLKTGAARLALGAARRRPDRTVRVVPSGLCYVNRRRFRSSVLVQYGEPLLVDAAWVGAQDADDRAAVRELTAEIDRRLRALTVNAEAWETVRVLDGVRRLYQPPEIRLEDRVELARRFNAVYPEVRDLPEVRALYARVEGYLDRLDDLGLADRDLRRTFAGGEIAARIARHLLLLGLWMPLAALGALVHVPLGFGVRHLGPRIAPRKDVVGTTKFVVGLLGVLALYGGGAAAAAVLGGWQAGVAVAVLLPLSGYASLRVLDRWTFLRRTLAAFWRLLRFRDEVDGLRAERAVLEAAVVAAVGRLRPADMALLFPREPGVGA